MIDIELFRARIGIFQCCKLCITKSKKLGYQHSKTYVRKKSLNQIMIIILLFLAATLPSYQVILQSSNTLRSSPQNILNQSHFSEYYQEEVWCNGISWSSPTATNKLCHSIHGNQRNQGYKYCSWNCDKGFINENKMT